MELKNSYGELVALCVIRNYDLDLNTGKSLFTVFNKNGVIGTCYANDSQSIVNLITKINTK